MIKFSVLNLSEVPGPFDGINACGVESPGGERGNLGRQHSMPDAVIRNRFGEFIILDEGTG